MPPPIRGDLSDAEREVLRAVWDVEPATVRQLHAAMQTRGKTWGYTTVLKLLQRLHAKGCVASDTTQPAHVFRSVATRDNLLQEGLQALADNLCEGAPAPLVLALVQGQKFSPEEIARFRRLLDEIGGDPAKP